MKERYKFIVVILVYRNYSDLIECIDSINKHVKECKIIVVNAYYDEISKNKIKKVAIEKKSDFLNIENKGYSYGNNRGIEYANNNYEYEYIIISNPDIVVRKFDDIIPDAGIIAPKIIAASGKNQNPMIIKENGLVQFLIYYGFKNKKQVFYLIGIVLNKCFRFILALLNKHNRYYEIFAAHGSFVIIKKDVINSIFPLYDENLFLFAEEGVLAKKCQQNDIRTVYDSDIVVNHKEDGSMKLADFSINDELSKANIYFYENYILSK